MLSPKELKQAHLDAAHGYGLMGLTWAGGVAPKEQAFAALNKVVELTPQKPVIFNVGEFYGPDYSNLKLARSYFEAHPGLREQTVVTCKGCVDNKALVPHGDRAFVTQSIENSMKAFGGPFDIFQPARLDEKLFGDNVYPDETFETLVEYIKKGSLGGLSLSEVNAEQIRAIHAKYGEYICCVEVEFSLYHPEILTNGIVDACNELGIPIVCYSPLCRGLLTGAITSPEDLKAGDFKSMLKKFKGEALKHNLKLVDFLQKEIVSKRSDGLTLPSLALAWIRSFNSKYLGTKFVPIPGASSAKRVEQNFTSYDLTQEELAKIDGFLKTFKTAGDRYEFET
ncbi:pyridoxine 4-dehydrogenase [Lachancea thermotolerans CBS 6340]|uniref:KLTH0D13750p n=1 Tax=Lachancea thermotolerans (strain ATCC 56472 / CBS 6340 / NRRL Y-8284) TaxID=559295 RepID=C5DFB5_LACTC|nr:KLTH0D13750p [Lachancea thermotolerans CBS 6340]CAR22870.1 KLTH0D13750p [Lachancea thermotolerans CBS 6340]